MTEIIFHEQELSQAKEYARVLEQIIQLNKEALGIANAFRLTAKLNDLTIFESSLLNHDSNQKIIQNLQLLVGQLWEENHKLSEITEKAKNNMDIIKSKSLVYEKIQEETKKNQLETIHNPKEKIANLQVITNKILPFEDFVSLLGTWKKSLKPAWSDQSFIKMVTFLSCQYSTEKIYPPSDLIFNAFTLTPMHKIRVVIIGQDPYHQPGQAMGLCFSVPKGIKIPPSLLNVYKSLETDKDLSKPFKRPNHGDLTKWANQGVLLLNSLLTVQDSCPNSHKGEGWQAFTDTVVKVINKECDKIVWMLWGSDAQKKAARVNIEKHFILKTSHPSGLSFNKGFSEAYHFSKCNDYLKKNSFPEIDWNLD